MKSVRHILGFQLKWKFDFLNFKALIVSIIILQRSSYVIILNSGVVITGLNRASVSRLRSSEGHRSIEKKAALVFKVNKLVNFEAAPNNLFLMVKKYV